MSAVDSPRLRAWPVRSLLMVMLGGVLVVGIGLATDSVAEAASIQWSGNVNLGSAGYTVAAGDTVTFSPNADTTVTSGGNIIVRGTLIMKPGNGNVDHVIRFSGVNEQGFVGGGLDPVASDVGLWVMGSGRIILEGESKPAWGYSWQSAWAGDEVRAAPNTLNNYGSFPVVTGTPAKNALGYATELLNLTRNVRVEGTTAGYSHVFIRSTRPSTIKNAQFRYMAPDFGGSDITGRYGLHIHMSHEGSRGTVVDGLVIRDTKGHAFVPHMSNGITFKNTIAFNVGGEAYWWDEEDTSDDIIFDRAVAALVRMVPGGENHRMSAFFLGAGDNVTVTNSVAVGVQNNEGGADRSGYIWPEDAEATWTFKNNRAHNNDSNGIFVWQNNELPHVIEGFTAYYNEGAGVEHGAYTNSYVYKNLVLRNNGTAIHSHALGEPGDAGADTQIWANISTRGGTLVIDEHAREAERPVRFVGCDFGTVQVEDSGGPEASVYDFISCGLEPSDFDLGEARSDSVFRVQRSNGTAYRLLGNGSVTKIGRFYTGSVPGATDPCPTAVPALGSFRGVGDFSGDGRSDAVTYDLGSGRWFVFQSDGSGFAPQLWSQFTTRSGWSSRLVGDFSGDNRDDVANFHPSNGTWWVSRSTGALFSSSVWADFSTANGWGTRLVGDFNGDGRDDIANYHPSTGGWWVSRSTGSAFVTTMWADFATFCGWKTHLVGDFNGDGRDDIASYHPSNGTWWISRSTGTGFVTTMWADFATASGWSSHIVGDFNGDGRDDIANYIPTNGTWWVSRSTGSAFATTKWADFSTGTGWGAQVAGDFNNDGRDDIGNYHTASGGWWVSRSNGAAFTTTRWADFTTTTGWTNQMIGDFNNDGRADIANRHTSGNWIVSRSTGTTFNTTTWYP